MQDTASPHSQPPQKITQDQLDALVGLHNRFLEGRVGGRRATLRNTDMTSLSLKGHNLRQASFIGCIMVGMDLAGANFQEASLYACDLSNSNLLKTRFIRADLRGARIENANLEGANLEKADLRVGGLSDGGAAYDSGQAVNFRGANLSGAKLTGSMATRADFSDAILSGANIANADLRGAMLEGADLSNAEVGGAKFNGANLKSAILTGIEMESFNSHDVDISAAITDDNIGTSVAALSQPLEKLIEDHRAWVESAGKSGKQLDLSGVDMRQLKSLKQEKLTAIRADGTKFFGMIYIASNCRAPILRIRISAIATWRARICAPLALKTRTFLTQNLRMQTAVLCCSVLAGRGGISALAILQAQNSVMQTLQARNSKMRFSRARTCLTRICPVPICAKPIFPVRR